MENYNNKEQFILLIGVCLIYGGIAALGVLFYKKELSDNQTNNNSNNKKKRRLPTNEEIYNVAKSIKEALKTLMTAEYKKNIKTELEKLKEDYQEDYKFPKFLAEPDGDFIIVIDDEQEVNAAFNFVLNDIIKILNSKPEYKTFHFNTGDGYEGCIYVEVDDE